MVFSGILKLRLVGGDASRNGAELFEIEADFSAKIVTLHPPIPPPKSATGPGLITDKRGVTGPLTGNKGAQGPLTDFQGSQARGPLMQIFNNLNAKPVRSLRVLT